MPASRDVTARARRNSRGSDARGASVVASVVVFDTEPRFGIGELPVWLSTRLSELDRRRVTQLDELSAVLRRSRPALVVVDARFELLAGAGACARCKSDAYSALVPCVALAPGDVSPDGIAALLQAGADEVIAATASHVEAGARVDATLRRAQRDLSAQPTTGLPGPPAIEAFLDAQLRAGVPFAACYADLDHFKEYNDRYGFHEGDRVIRMVARMLHDVALGAGGTDAFVGHIGGDDFLCVLPLDVAADACALIVETFDLIAPLQYNAADRRAGYYLGKDRRGQLHRVPLMSLSLGVATTERRRYASAADVSRLASEMKSFAKSLAGSVFAFDRRGDDDLTPPASPAIIE